MIQRQAYKYRLKTKPADELFMRQFSGCCWFVWNKALALQKERLEAGERTISYNKLSLLLAVMEEGTYLPERCPVPNTPAGADESRSGY